MPGIRTEVTEAERVWIWVLRGLVGIILTGILTWATWATLEITGNKREIAVIQSNQYTPGDRRDDSRLEEARFQQVTTKMETVNDRLGNIEGDMKEMRAILERIENRRTDG